MKLQPIFVEILPEFEEVKFGQIWISHKHRTINLRCPCGCNELTVLSIHPSRWHVHFDGMTVSLAGPTGGSVWAVSGCSCHYVIKNSEVVWLDRIDPSLQGEYEAVEKARFIALGSSGSQNLTLIQRTKRKLIDFLARMKHGGRSNK